MKALISVLLLLAITPAKAQYHIGDPLLYKDEVNTRVGINTLTPAYTLDVNGTSRLVGAVTLSGAINGTTASLSGSLTASTLTVTGNAFSVGGSTLAVISGRVQIGAQPYPTERPAFLDVSGPNDAGPGATSKGIFKIQGTDVGQALGFGLTTASPYTAWLQNIDPRTGQSTTYPLALNPSGGNVGIGTTAPPAKLSVSTATTSVSFYSIGGAKTKAEILAFDPVGPGESFYCTDCASAMVCVSTGTAVADFADIGDRTVACN